MVVTSHHTKVCFDAWINCEDVLTNIAQARKNTSKQITKIVDECALICMSTFHALKSRSVNANRYALLCIGICEECAELCEELNGSIFKQCAKACKDCSETMSRLLPLFPEDEA